MNLYYSRVGNPGINLSNPIPGINVSGSESDFGLTAPYSPFAYVWLFIMPLGLPTRDGRRGMVCAVRNVAATPFPRPFHASPRPIPIQFFIEIGTYLATLNAISNSGVSFTN